MACKEIQKMNEGDRSREDLLLVSLAKNQSWKRCPACKIYAERTQGCWYMRCSSEAAAGDGWKYFLAREISSVNLTMLLEASMQHAAYSCTNTKEVFQAYIKAAELILEEVVASNQWI
ncbi:hypothetical protein AKJ16_DCAP27602, partial [Drosera capensis]